MHKTVRKILRTVADYDPDYYDMYADANEAWFAQLYLERVLRHAANAGLTSPATLLEAGCQAGRLAVRFAQRGFHVTGIDTSGFAIRRAREHAQHAGVDLKLIRGDLVEVLRKRPESRYDIVVCAEVLYLSAQYRPMLAALAGAVRPGGLLCVSHRTTFYYLLEAVRLYDLPTAARVLHDSEGSFRDSKYYNWQDEQQLRELYASVDVPAINLYPIDRLSWLTGISPQTLTEAQRAQWLDLELQLGEPATCGRYVLVIGSKAKTAA